MNITHVENGVPIKAWTDGVPVEDVAREQLHNLARMPFVFKHVAVMPDVHFGIGASVGSVIATRGAIIPAAVGVDIGCGMNAVRTSLKASDLPDSLAELRHDIERSVPVGNNKHQRPEIIEAHFKRLPQGDKRWGIALIVGVANDKGLERASAQLGTLGGGNHFIEICLDENQAVWVMLHSGSRGIGNMIGRQFIEQAKQLMEKNFTKLPDRDLAYFPVNTPEFNDYMDAVSWCQDYALENRRVMMELVIKSMRHRLPAFTITHEAINSHHNYVAKEHHFGENVYVTRKGAVRAREGDLGIIPGSMGARSYIVRGRGNPDSFCSCSHGAGRAMSRTQARKRFTLDDHANATQGVECRKDAAVIDETPAAYKSIDAVMAAQDDLVEIVHTLKQVVCVKG